MPITVTKDGTSIDLDTGHVLFFSLERFVKDICRGNCCFICGANPGTKSFNDEHILPNWILKKFNLHNLQVTLPNGSSFKYGSYVIPCCTECNTMMGSEFEDPIQRLFALGSEAVIECLVKEGPKRLFLWLNLIFLKTHLKDNLLRYHLDHRMGNEKIGDLYAWESLHHIHCIARSFYNGAILEPAAFGTLYVFHAKADSEERAFDFVDLYEPRSIMIRIDNLVLFAVLNDACAVLNIFNNVADKITGALSPIQIREVLGHLAYLNLNLVDRPSFHTEVDLFTGRVTVGGTHSNEVTLKPYESRELGAMLFRCCGDLLARCVQPNIDEVIADLKAGKKAFLLDGDKFIENSMLPMTPPSLDG